MNHTNKSIFQRYFDCEEFYDRYIGDPDDAVTVIIPVLHTNELWRSNLISIYREIPVKNLILGDAGCQDDTLSIANEFPRVTIHDHTDIESLGYSIRLLIESVQTDWFIYLHSDVFLPSGWFDSMKVYKGSYDWYGCRMRQTVMVEFDNDYGDRPYAGAQVGKKSAFINGIKRIEDDYVYRQEDFILSDIINSAGFKEGKIDEVYHYHQTLKKDSRHWNPMNMKVQISQQLNFETEVRVWNSQLRGIVKYLMPGQKWLASEVGISAFKLIKLGVYTQGELFSWISKVNPVWLPILKRELRRQRIMETLIWLRDRLMRIISM